MKTTFIIVLSGLLFVGCSQKQTSPTGSSHDSFVTQLDSQGYFKGLAPEKAQALKEDLRQKGWMAILDESPRFFTADGEDLAKGGICAFIREIQPFLSAQGVKLPDLKDEVSASGYVVRAGGVAHTIYDVKEMKGDVWGLASARGFALVDQMLEAAGSPERIYAINGGNDLFAIFLTPEMYHTISTQPDFDGKGGPYRLTEEAPWFGQPHK